MNTHGEVSGLEQALKARKPVRGSSFVLSTARQVQDSGTGLGPCSSLLCLRCPSA